MRKHITLLSLLLGLVLQAQPKDNFKGDWTADDGSVITIYLQDSSYFAKSDGEFVLIQMEKKSETQLYGGTFYDEEFKTEYEAKLKLINPNTIRLKVLKGLSAKTIIWRRTPLPLKKKEQELTLTK